MFPKSAAAKKEDQVRCFLSKQDKMHSPPKDSSVRDNELRKYRTTLGEQKPIKGFSKSISVDRENNEKSPEARRKCVKKEVVVSNDDDFEGKEKTLQWLQQHGFCQSPEVQEDTFCEYIPPQKTREKRKTFSSVNMVKPPEVSLNFLDSKSPALMGKNFKLDSLKQEVPSNRGVLNPPLVMSNRAVNHLGSSKKELPSRMRCPAIPKEVSLLRKIKQPSKKESEKNKTKPTGKVAKIKMTSPVDEMKNFDAINKMVSNIDKSVSDTQQEISSMAKNNKNGQINKTYQEIMNSISSIKASIRSTQGSSSSLDPSTSVKKSKDFISEKTSSITNRLNRISELINFAKTVRKAADEE
ncbi:uncharacterized protein LOC106669963 [Cimex lectularius]|uniref:Uncharacterized protein n=1 Tax=Cimex lectularius TaxID=79782 RepID=A0A8I6RZJ3_CIMLE|nr:uncharacterized protein LOC106669963 [Cimex lectularius]